MELDQIDSGILAELDFNARATNAEIGRRLNLSQNTIHSHIANLEKKGMIKGYFPIIDFLRLGYQSYRVYLKFQNISNKTEKEIMDYLKDSPLAWWCCHANGRFDFCAVFWFADTCQFLDLWDGFRRKYRQYLKEASIVPYLGEVLCGLPFTGFKEAVAIGSRELVTIGQKDRSILQALASNGRESFSRIAKAVGCTPTAVKYRIDQLVGKKVIKGFKPLLDMKHLSYTSYKVDIHLDSFENKQKMEDYLQKNQNVSNIIRTIGWADLEIKVYARSSKEFRSVLCGFRDEFPDSIRYFDFFEYPETVKESFMPDF